VVALSATMTFHVRALADLIAAIRASRVGDRVKVMVGGYPFNAAPELWRRVGADGWARDAVEAVAVAGRLAGNGAA
jgi:methanogenic corrinoid protein MtbC1